MTPTAAAALTFLAIAAYGALHSLLASPWAKAIAHRIGGAAADRVYRLGFNLIGAITLLPVLAIPALQPGPVLYRVPSPLSWAFLVGQGACVIVVLVGVTQTDVWHFLGLRQLDQTPSDRPPRFVDTGLYGHVRHPLYSAGMAFLWLTPVQTKTLLVLCAGFSLYFYIGSLFEERRLLAEFGQAYADYRRRVPRFVPWPRRARPSDASPGAAPG